MNGRDRMASRKMPYSFSTHSLVALSGERTRRKKRLISGESITGRKEGRGNVYAKKGERSRNNKLAWAFKLRLFLLSV